ETKGVGQIPIEGGPMSVMLPPTEQYWVPSPDTRLAAVTYLDKTDDRFKLAVVQIGTEQPETILDAWPIYILKWTPDSKSLIYREREAGEAPYSLLWQHEIDTNTKKPILDVSPDIIVDAAWSANRDRIAVIRGKLVTDAVMMTTIKSGTPAP
ncbi:MAG: hypothetical protein AB7J13_10650, partial [Pyrinomonadaceae bacterium]